MINFVALEDESAVGDKVEREGEGRGEERPGKNCVRNLNAVYVI